MPTRASCAGRWHKLATVGLALAIFVVSIFMVPLLGTEFVPKADFSETTLSFYTPVGSSLEVTEAKARRWRPSSAASPRCATR
jgi:multidrug efflux pump subunit AcrB